MENKLEQLLNSLIEKGWKPFGEWCHRSPYKRVGIHKNYNKERTYVLFYSNNHSHWKVLRQVVSRESWLWQFVCENKMVRLDTDSWESDSYLCYYNIDGYPKDDRFEMGRDDYRFRLIESALKDESELESFILDNIKV